jgi:hypothetical protein
MVKYDFMEGFLRSVTGDQGSRMPDFVLGGLSYVAVVGSRACGMALPGADHDVCGWYVPPSDMVFPHLVGDIPGFDAPREAHDRWAKTGATDPVGGQRYDVVLFGVVKFMRMVADASPNAIESLFVPDDCVVTSMSSGEAVRSKRRSFLSREFVKKVVGHATSRRAKAVKGPYDAKSAGHAVRLMRQAVLVATTGDLDLTEGAEEVLRIRGGEVGLEQVDASMAELRVRLETALGSSPLPDRTDQAVVKNTLLGILEEHYGSLAGLVVRV